MSVKEGCFAIGVSLLRIAMAAELAAWASNKKRVDEAKDFLSAVSIETSRALAADFIKVEEAEAIRQSIERHDEAAKMDNMEGVQDALAEISMRVHDIVFQKVVECEGSLFRGGAEKL